MSAPDSWEMCPVCQGSGVEDGGPDSDVDCFRCEGHGEVWRQDPGGHPEDLEEDDYESGMPWGQGPHLIDPNDPSQRRND